MKTPPGTYCHPSMADPDVTILVVRRGEDRWTSVRVRRVVDGQKACWEVYLQGWHSSSPSFYRLAKQIQRRVLAEDAAHRLGAQ